MRVPAQASASASAVAARVSVTRLLARPISLGTTSKPRAFCSFQVDGGVSRRWTPFDPPVPCSFYGSVNSFRPRFGRGGWRRDAFSSESQTPAFQSLNCGEHAFEEHAGDRASHNASVDVLDYSVVYRSSLFEYPPLQLPPRVEHILLPHSGPLSQVVSRILDVPEKYIMELSALGALHYSEVPPLPSSNASPETASRCAFIQERSLQLKLRQLHQTQPAEEATNLSHDPNPTPALTSLSSQPSFEELLEIYGPYFRDAQGSVLKGNNLQKARKLERVKDGNRVGSVGSYVRVHLHPKRYPRCYEVSWKDHIIFESNDFLILNKPAGVPK